MKFIGLFAIAAAFTAACPVAAQSSRTLAPSSQWNVDYDADSCALRRMFGEDGDRAYLELRRFGPGAELQAVVASERMTARNPVELRYRFANDAEWSKPVRAPTLHMAEGFSGVIFSPALFELPEYETLTDPTEREAYLRTIDLRAMERDAAARIDTLTLRRAFPRDLSLQLGPMTQAITALNQCVDELMTHWGIDVEAHKSLTRAAIPVNLPEVPRMMDYPPAMVRQSMPGIVNVRLAIDERGGITGCHIQMPLSDPAFERSSCADIQHALEFEPALDKDRKPIASYWITKVIFQIAG